MTCVLPYFDAGALGVPWKLEEGTMRHSIGTIEYAFGNLIGSSEIRYKGQSM